MPRYIAFNDPFWTDREPYCNTVRFITQEDAAQYTRRAHKERHGVAYPWSEERAISDFMVEHWAWFCDLPDIPCLSI